MVDASRQFRLRIACTSPRPTRRIDRRASDELLAEFKVHDILPHLGNEVQHPLGLADHLGADAVTGEENDEMLWLGHLWRFG